MYMYLNLEISNFTVLQYMYNVYMYIHVYTSMHLS